MLVSDKIYKSDKWNMAVFQKPSLKNVMIYKERFLNNVSYPVHHKV